MAVFSGLVLSNRRVKAEVTTASMSSIVSHARPFTFLDGMPGSALRALELVDAVGLTAGGAAVHRQVPAGVGKVGPGCSGRSMARADYSRLRIRGATFLYGTN